MRSKLGGYFISRGGIDVPGYLGTAPPRMVVSMEHSVDTWRAAERASPNTSIIGRHDVDDSDQVFLDDPEGRAQQFFAVMEGEAEQMRGIYHACMGCNESVIQSPDEAQRLSRFYVRWGDLIRAAGFKSAAYSFATGNPARGDPRPDGSLEPNYWPLLADGLRHCDLLSLHEYSAPTMDVWATFLCLRYRKVMGLLVPDACRQIVITETGIDGGAGPANRPQQGWSKFTDAVGCVSTLSWYDGELQKDDYVIGATIFAMNGWGIDGSFGMGSVMQIRDYIAQGGTQCPGRRQAAICSAATRRAAGSARHSGTADSTNSSAATSRSDTRTSCSIYDDVHRSVRRYIVRHRAQIRRHGRGKQHCESKSRQTRSSADDSAEELATH